ncbi:MAG: tetratricopeptide repeat protein [Deltaproteobacteria bacterium]|nr:tetratricopeptide repeat protein [Deltaproteobacteria bacterium]
MRTAVRIRRYILAGSLLLLLNACATGRQMPAPDERPGERLAAEYLSKAERYEQESNLVAAYRHFKLARTVSPLKKEAIEGCRRLEKRLRDLARAHYERGMRYQRQGKYGRARQQFLVALRLMPDYGKVVKRLTGRKRLRIKRYVLHTIQRGDSLSKIAENYYGDHTKFTIIAEFNNIADVTKIRVGQQVKVPEIEGLKFLAKKGQVKTDLQYVYEGEEWDWESSLLESGTPPVADDSIALQIAFYRRHGEELFEKGRYVEAAEEFRKLLERDPGDEKALSYATRAHLLIGKGFLEKGQYLMAREEFKKALEYDAQCAECRRFIKESEALYKEYHYKRGMKYYGEEKLEEAIKEWELVKKIDPDYKRLKYLIQKAEKILERLEVIKQSSQAGGRSGAPPVEKTGEAR